MGLTTIFISLTIFLFLLSALAAYFFHAEFVGGENFKEWKLLYVALVLFSVSNLAFVIGQNLEIQILEPGSEVLFLLSSSVLCVSCFMFWNKFRL